MRIVSGRYRGKSLTSPKDRSTRPTSDRVRESLFNILSHNFEGLEWETCRVLDLFAGTGALGLEAISRGAAYCVFVEQSAGARGIIRENIENLNLTGHSRIFRRDATKLGASGTAGQFNLIFADPPYEKGLGEKAMTSALEGGWLAPDALFVLEESRRAEFEAPKGFTLLDERTYGDSVISIFGINSSP